MDARAEMDRATGEVAWDLVIQYHYPLSVVAKHLNRTPEQIQELLLEALVPRENALPH